VIRILSKSTPSLLARSAVGVNRGCVSTSGGVLRMNVTTCPSTSSKSQYAAEPRCPFCDRSSNFKSTSRVVYTFHRTFAHVAEVKIDLIGFEENLGLTPAWVAVIRDNFGRVLCTGIIKRRSAFYAKRYVPTDNLYKMQIKRQEIRAAKYSLLHAE
jgi:hypothetical protein